MRLRQDIEKLNRLVMHRGSPLNLMRRDSSEIATTTDLKVGKLYDKYAYVNLDC